jgi:hypothetical protein
LLQVRPIAAKRRWADNDTETLLNSRIEHVAGFVAQLMTPRQDLYGVKSILGVMPDWNPAEMIGIHPKPLAVSLYRELITRDVWRLARAQMGYRMLPPTELMVMLGGVPFIDVRASFNSFLPHGISGTMGETLVNAWLDRLDKNPVFHDKVEFEIVSTVLTPDFANEFDKRYGDALSPAELAEYRLRLTDLTQKALEGESLDKAMSDVERLRNIQMNTLSSEREAAAHLRQFDLALRLVSAIECCRTLGTLPFAVLARHGFIAETWLRAVVRVGALSGERLALFKRSIETVSGKITSEFNEVLSGKISREDFLHTYGHLRLGMYDILSPSYRERADLFEASPREGHSGDARRFALTGRERKNIDALLSSCGFQCCAEIFLDYVRRAVAGREYGKFIFSRHVDHMLFLVRTWGKLLDFSPDDLSMLAIGDICSLGFQPLPSSGREYFEERIKDGRREYELGNFFKLSYLIRSPRDVYIVPQHRSQPNFIGNRAVEAEVAVLVSGDHSPDMQGRIVCIESADPGYDWIFTRNIAGLVTRYGGANSHMAIRCAEYGLPAAIGCGEQIFETAVAARRLRLDCAAKNVTPVAHPLTE